MDRLSFELDTEPYARERDLKVEEICAKHSTQVEKVTGHTLLEIKDLEAIG